jgi:CheY-like chemotaxis protein
MSVLRGKRVLVADDEPYIRFCVAYELEDDGSEVVEATDGAEALDLIAGDARIAALVTDVRMPNMDGWTLAERVRELRPGLPVLYITGHSDVSARPVAGSLVLAKPFRSLAVRTSLATLMSDARTTADYLGGG